MTGPEALAITSRLMTLFPALADDEARCAGIMKELEKVSRSAAVRAIEDYNTLGETLLHMSQLMAIAYRHDRQDAERADAAAKAEQRNRERDDFERQRTHLSDADAIIRDMTDEEVRKEWVPILAKMTGKPREWAEKWPMSVVRTNVQFKLRIAGLAGVR